jgi:hypothetical protein
MGGFDAGRRAGQRPGAHGWADQVAAHRIMSVRAPLIFGKTGSTRATTTSCLIALALASVAPLRAEEGKWTPQQVLQLDAGWLKRQGLQLPVSRLWNPQRGTGLLAAAVAVPGCSAAFVSATGLILTNHHCLFSLIQEHSRPDRDLIASGFLARTRSEELPGQTMRVTVPRRFTDVTRDVEAAAAPLTDDTARAKAIEDRQKSLVAACERTPGSRCSVAAFDGGLQYTLVETFELTDVRLVYAPPRAVGEFGGEADNFRWPRHVGDFAVARAYKDGKPFVPEFFFPIARKDVEPGDFVMVMGYPGRTFRSLTADEMANERRFRFEMARDVYGEWIAALERVTRGDAQGTISVAAQLKSLNNSHTNAQGQLEGLGRGRLIERQRANDEAVSAWAQGQPAFASSLAAKRELDGLAAVRRATGVHDYLLTVIPNGALALKHAAFLVRLAKERQKPDAERAPNYQARDWARQRAALERDQHNFFQPADEALFASWLARARQEHVAAAERVGDAASLYRGSTVTNLAERLKMFDETPEQLRARHDWFLDFAFALDDELRTFEKAAEARDGAVARLRPVWRRAVIAHAGAPVAPDANATLRVSFAHVKGYSPRDGVRYTPKTTLAGMLEKHSGEEPFAVPEFIRQAAATADASRVPLDFLSDADTTGGNSGSPVVNGRGELVGLNFDRVWENVANDFGYNPDVARNISVDIRFLEWLLRDVQHADLLLSELGLAK